MTNIQLYFAVGLPCLTVIASLVISLFQISGVREDIREIRSDIKLMTGKLAEIDTDVTLIKERMK